MTVVLLAVGLMFLAMCATSIAIAVCMTARELRAIHKENQRIRELDVIRRAEVLALEQIPVLPDRPETVDP